MKNILRDNNKIHFIFGFRLLINFILVSHCRSCLSSSWHKTSQVAHMMRTMTALTSDLSDIIHLMRSSLQWCGGVLVCVSSSCVSCCFSEALIWCVMSHTLVFVTWFVGNGLCLSHTWTDHVMEEVKTSACDRYVMTVCFLLQFLISLYMCAPSTQVSLSLELVDLHCIHTRLMIFSVH